MSLSPRARRGRLSLILTLVALVAALLIPYGTVSAKAPPKIVDIQILGLNDFHGQLEPAPTSSSAGRIGSLTSGVCVPGTCVPAGGVEYLATHVRNLRATNPNTVFVSAGDLIGATPLLSALFHDEPTIEAFNQMGLEFNGVGNHEFDEGVDELLRVAYGSNEGPGYKPARTDGCHPIDGCGDEDPYGGADFQFLAANVTYKDTGATVFAPYQIKTFEGGAKVAFVGMTTKDTPNIVSPGGIAHVDFLDEAATVNALVPKLRKQGIEAIVVLLHEGGQTTVPGNGAGGAPDAIDSCINPSGVVPGIVNALDDEIDIVITGHTNWAVNCVIDGKVVTGAAAQGRLITEIDAKVDARTDEFIKPIMVDNTIVTQDVPKAADLTALIAEYKVYEGPVAAVVVGSTSAPIRRTTNPAGESELGRLIADAQLADMADAPGNAVIAFMNPGGIRNDILESGDLTHGEAFSVQPFSNVVMTRAFTGAEIEAILEQQFLLPNGNPRTLVLAVSNGFTYTWDAAAVPGSKVDPASIKLGGVTLDPAATYNVAMNNFLGFGGDTFPTMLAGDVVGFGSDDLVALEAYFAANSPVAPPTDVRITRLN